MDKTFILCRLYKFGLESGVGADKLSDFFKMIRLHTPIGVSASSLRTQLSEMERLLPLFQKQCEEQAGTTSRKAVVAIDETFFGRFMILVSIFDIQFQ